MRIAFISFEFPPAVAIGGIGAYTEAAAEMMAALGHSVEVFAACAPGTPTADRRSFPVHRIPAADRSAFRKGLPEAFLAAHRTGPFDVMESPEIGCEAAGVKAALPRLAHVIRLHTCTAILSLDGWAPPPASVQLRFLLSRLLRGRLEWLSAPAHAPDTDEERLGALAADLLVAPTRAMSRRLAPLWRLSEESIEVLPNVLIPSPALLALCRPPTGSCVAFLGRLERRKGYDTLVRALPRVLGGNPEARALFIGPAWPRPYSSQDSVAWSRRELRAFGPRVHFTGGLASTAVPAALAESDLVVLPSRWENFPYACAEAMAAGRCVIGSSEGGMADMIRHGVNGYLSRPDRPAELAELIGFLLRQPALREAAGAAARATITGQLSPALLGPAQEALYRKAIALAAARP